MADEIRIGITTDVSALKAGLAEAQAAVQKASADMAEAQSAFGRAAEQGSDQAKAALGEYTAALQAAEDQLDALTAKQASATSAMVRPQGQETAFASWREAAAAQAPAVARGGIS